MPVTMSVGRVDFFTLWKLARRLETEGSPGIGKNNLCPERRTGSRTPFVPGPVGDVGCLPQLMLRNLFGFRRNFGSVFGREWPTGVGARYFNALLGTV